MKLNKLRIQANEKGFTLIELMIVIAIIGILAAVAIPNFIAYRDKAFCSQAESDANSIAATLANYFAIPSHTTLFSASMPQMITGNKESGGVATVIDFLTYPVLSTKNTASVSGGVSNLIINVLDGSTRCPEDYMLSNSEWSWTTKSYTKAME